MKANVFVGLTRVNKKSLSIAEAAELLTNLRKRGFNNIGLVIVR